jgi:hypothetical protein
VSSKETSKPRPGYITANKGQIKKGLSLLIEKHPQKDPVISIVLINVEEHESCPKDYVEIPLDITSGNFGSSAFRLCFKTSAVQRVAYEPKVLDRFPLKNHADYKFPNIITEFCFPQGVRWATEDPMPKFFSFVFTDENKKLTYGFALQFYEPLTAEQLEGLEKLKQAPKLGKPVYAPKCAVLLSHWPYYEQFKTFLVLLHRIVVSPSYIPFERHLEAVMYSVPVPHPASIFKYRIGHKTLEFVMPPLLSLPLLDLELRQLFLCLDIPSIVTIFEQLLLENKIIFYSNHLGVLNPVAESFRALLFPFNWQNVYTPVLPMFFAHAIQAPFPFFVGMNRTFFDEVRVNDDVTLVDLDRNHVKLGRRPDDPLVTEILPKEMRDDLIAELSKFSNIYEKEDFSKDKDDQVSSLHARPPDEYDEEKVFQPQMVRLTFLKFFVRILQSYADFLNPLQICSFIPLNKKIEQEKFYSDDFLKNCVPEMQNMMSRIISTQYFSVFIQERVSDDVPFETVFFDFCMTWHKWEAEDFMDRVLGVISKETIPKQNMHNVKSVENDLKEFKSAPDSTILFDCLPSNSYVGKPIVNPSFPLVNVSRFEIPNRPPVEDKNFIVIFQDLFPQPIVSALDETWKNIALMLIHQVHISSYGIFAHKIAEQNQG